MTRHCRTFNLSSLIAIVFLLAGFDINQGKLIPAFPGAEGFGAYALGGRGGEIIEVTTLNDSGPGSLRAAIETHGPRIVVFKVGGTIKLQSTLTIQNPYITIAGQTAPGGGIALRNVGGNDGPSMTILDTHDVVIRYLRFRPGPNGAGTCCIDALSVVGSNNVMVDHISASWAVDEVLGIARSQNVTVQWSMIAEGLRNAGHEKGTHSMGILLGEAKTTNITLHHNLLAHNKERNPRLQAGLIDIVNNVIYNAVGHPGVFGDDFGNLNVNYVGNYYQRGPDSDTDEMIALLDRTRFDLSVYVSGNIGPTRPTDNLDNTLVVRTDDRYMLTDQRYNTPQVTTTSAFKAYEQVLANAGAIFPRRDSVDEQIVAEVRTGTGRLIDNPAQVGGWPSLESGTPYADSDGDGMADDFELANGLNPRDSSDGPQDPDGDGYTNIEAFLNTIGH